jgi:hypothetical protein
MGAGASGRRGGRGFRFAKAQSATHRGEWPELANKEPDSAGIAISPMRQLNRWCRDARYIPAYLPNCASRASEPLQTARVQAGFPAFPKTPAWTNVSLCGFTGLC